MVEKESGTAFDELGKTNTDEQDENNNDDTSTDKKHISKESRGSNAKQPKGSRKDDAVTTDEQRDTTGPSLKNSQPPFPWSDVDQNSIYPRSETWEEFSDLRFEIEGELRRRYGVKNSETREIDEAILQVLVEELDPEIVAERIIQNRGFEP